MFVKILITLFTLLPPALAFAASTKSLSTAQDSNTLYNLALDEQKNGNQALALALSERSHFINPLNFDAIKLTRLSYDSLSNLNNERMPTVPIIFKVLDFIPYLFLLILCFLSFMFFAWRLGLTIKKERTDFKSYPKLRLQSYLCAALALVLTGLVALKSHSLNEVWACVTQPDTGLFTGPNISAYTKVGSLSPGSCSKVMLFEGAWLSLAPAGKTAGWALKSQVLIVRTNKFDPLFKSD